MQKQQGVHRNRLRRLVSAERAEKVLRVVRVARRSRLVLSLCLHPQVGHQRFPRPQAAREVREARGGRLD